MAFQSTESCFLQIPPLLPLLMFTTSLSFVAVVSIQLMFMLRTGADLLQYMRY